MKMKTKVGKLNFIHLNKFKKNNNKINFIFADRWTINASAVAATENNLFTSKVSTNRVTHFVIHSKDMLNFTVSTNTISIIDLLTNALTNEKNGIPIVPVKIGKLYLHNNVGYPSKIEFFIRKEDVSWELK